MTSNLPDYSTLPALIGTMANQVAGLIKEKKKAIACEWVWDKNIGLPGIEMVLAKELSQAKIRDLIVGTIEMIPGIKKVQKIWLKVKPKKRLLFIRFQAKLAEHTSFEYVEVEDITPPELKNKPSNNFSWYDHLTDQQAQKPIHQQNWTH